MLCDPREISVRREEDQVVANTELGEESVDRADLYALPAAAITHLRGINVILSVGPQERKS